MRLFRQLGPGRLAATILFLFAALLIARFSWHLPLAAQAERALYDLRLSQTAEMVDPDPRIVMVVYNDDTLIETRKRSPLDRATLARALANLDTMGAKAIGIDILIDQPQDEDEALLATFRAMQTPTFLAYASAATNVEDIQFNQQQFLDEFQKRLAGTRVKPASIRFQVDSDNVVRSWPQRVPGLPPLLSVAMTDGKSRFADYDRSIRFRIPAEQDRAVFDAFPIQLFADDATAAAFADQVRGKYVLLGGTIIDVDEFETPLRPFTGKSMWGLEVHAHMLAQLLDDAWLEALPRWGTWGIAIMVVVAGALSSLLGGAWWRVSFFLAIQLGFFIGYPIWLQADGTDTQYLPAFGWMVGWVIAFAAIGTAARAVGSEQRRFAQSALGKYLPRDIANQILADPDRLALHGEKREIFVVFTDLEGFTKLSHAIQPEMVAKLLNRYLDMMSDVVLEYGGTIDKFVGDAVVAFWGAPIARPDDGERAARAAYAMWQAGEEFRASVPEGVPPIGQTRVGLHFGEAIVGNFGGEGRIQYTALGDSMNTASRLEAANKQLGSGVMASRAAVDRSGLDWWRPMGRVVLRGRSTPVEIYQPVPDLDASDRDHFKALMNRVADGDKMAVQELESLANAKGGDAALVNLVYRLKNMESGGSYVLD
ncbi:adenylate/guanylate cyclase domain-containing protein [Sphingomonas cavernae]|uniref:Adenylate/guanylate cyclase domain-containing protein n=1 Tax=Sphingomonas cavernae TaxID=2320861 RepID=A0A418WSF2_9SPHN|nr:adenylate/guanylate cyclase domain-containing protein [Sphingomonas cavernae]